MIFSKYVNNQRAFTLIEMMIVMMIITALLLIAIPNMTTNNKLAQEKGCDATIALVQAQVGAYQIEEGKLPLDLEVLVTDKYVDKVECPNGTKLTFIGGIVGK
ncbi:competence type IV pilus major pilin ComGC [Bacillaceae bacterium IKA-2]|nr:competence type IV pilus major pilin ComGC [Bacillaceae bacterium IKA-2]